MHLHRAHRNERCFCMISVAIAQGNLIRADLSGSVMIIELISVMPLKLSVYLGRKETGRNLTFTLSAYI